MPAVTAPPRLRERRRLGGEAAEFDAMRSAFDPPASWTQLVPASPSDSRSAFSSAAFFGVGGFLEVGGLLRLGGVGASPPWRASRRAGLRRGGDGQFVGLGEQAGRFPTGGRATLATIGAGSEVALGAASVDGSGLGRRGDRLGLNGGLCIAGIRGRAGGSIGRLVTGVVGGRDGGLGGLSDRRGRRRGQGERGRVRRGGRAARHRRGTIGRDLAWRRAWRRIDGSDARRGRRHDRRDGRGARLAPLGRRRDGLRARPRRRGFRSGRGTRRGGPRRPSAAPTASAASGRSPPCATPDAGHRLVDRARRAALVADQREDEGADALRRGIAPLQQRLERGEGAGAVARNAEAEREPAARLVGLAARRARRDSRFAPRAGCRADPAPARGRRQARRWSRRAAALRRTSAARRSHRRSRRSPRPCRSWARDPTGALPRRGRRNRSRPGCRQGRARRGRR